MPLAIKTNFGEQQRLITCKILQTSKIRLHSLAVLQKNVKANEIQKAEVEIFRRRKIDVGDQSLRILSLGCAIKSLDESLDTPGGTGTVFNLNDDDGSTTVIWVTPEDTVEGI